MLKEYLIPLSVVFLFQLMHAIGALIAQDVSPPSNSSIYGQAGSSVMVNCSIYDNSSMTMLVTEWRLDNTVILTGIGDGGSISYEGSEPLAMPIGSIVNTQNVLTILNYNLNDRVLECQLGQVIYARYFLFLYRPVSLVNYTTLSVIEGESNVTINMEGAAITALPYPSSFSWMFNGSPASNTSAVTFGFPSVIFHTVSSSLGGSYSLSASNYFLDDPNRLLGTSSGSLELQVLFGPYLRRGNQQVAVELGSPLSLLCGDQLRSNPPPTITWRNSAGGVVTDSTRLDLISDVSGVRLNFSQMILMDNGSWSCNLSVVAVNVNVPPDGQVQTKLEVGSVQYDIDVIVIDPPGEPTSLLVEAVGGTWAVLDWVHPLMAGLQGISFYEITAVDVSGDVSDKVVFTPDGTTMMNVTNLLPATTYSFSVLAVSRALGLEVRGQPSNVDNSTTLTTAPAPICTSVSPSSGGISVEYSFRHTGGQPLTKVSISYTSSSSTTQQPGPPVGVADTMATIPGVVAGYSYTVAVTATNLNGSTTAACPSISVTSGRPQAPTKLLVREVGAGLVEVTVQLIFPGSERLNYNLTVLLVEGGRNTVVSVETGVIQNYMNGESWPITIPNLMVGGTYRFMMAMANEFGPAVGPVPSADFTVAGSATSPGSSTGGTSEDTGGGASNAGTVVGVAVGVVLGVLVTVVLAVVIIIIILLLLGRVRGKSNYEMTKTRVEYIDSGSDSNKMSNLTDNNNHGSVDLGVELSLHYQAPPSSSPSSSYQPPKEITYAELDNFKPPKSSQRDDVQNSSPSTIKKSIPMVEYASIDLFKKAPVGETTPTLNAVAAPSPVL